MTAHGIVSAIIIGIVMGVLGRLILPGRQRIGIIATVVVGVAAALLGSWASQAMGIRDNAPGRFDWNAVGWHLTWSWAELGVQVLFAVVGIALAAALTRTAVGDGDRPVRRRTRTRTRV